MGFREAATSLAARVPTQVKLLFATLARARLHDLIRLAEMKWLNNESCVCVPCAGS